MAIRIRTYWPDDDTWSYFEADDSLWPVRQVDLRGPEHEPVTAAVLREVLWIRDHANLEAMAAYERQYGVLAEGDLSGWQDADQATQITAEEFERLWAAARQTLEATQPSEKAPNQDRTRLIVILKGTTEACEPARAALRSGGDFIVWDGQSPAGHLARIYGRRMRHTQRRGIETLGLEQTGYDGLIWPRSGGLIWPRPGWGRVTESLCRLEVAPPGGLRAGASWCCAASGGSGGAGGADAC